MKKLLIGSSVLLNIVLVGVFVFSNFRTSRSVVQLPVVAHGEKSYAVAILMPVSHKALEEIRTGFEETLAKKMDVDCRFDVYNANGNRSLMRSQIEDIIQKKYDLIVPIGAMATQMTKEVTTKKQAQIPVVFSAVADPVRLGLIDSLQSSGNHLTGSATSPNYPLQVSLLLELNPQIKKALLVYDPTQSSGLEQDKEQVVNEFKKRNIAIRAVQVYSTADVGQKVIGMIQGNDLVMILKDNTVVPAVDALVQHCSRNKVLLFVSDLDSVSKGAALGFGVREYQFGADAASRAKMVLVDGKHPSEVPIKLTDDFRMQINTDTMLAQGLNMSQHFCDLVKAAELVSSHSA